MHISSIGGQTIVISKQAIDNALSYGGYSHEENCKKHDFDYNLFKRIYNNDLSVTLNELIIFARKFQLILSEFIILF